MDVQDDEDDFHVIPRGPVGRVAFALVLLGFASFIAGVASAPSGALPTTALAVGGMVTVFAGGLVRAYAR